MSAPHLVLLHAPGVYDFRQEAILCGPLADFAVSPLALERLPLSFASLTGYLEHGGYRVRVLNLARHMLEDPAFDAEAAIAGPEPLAFGISLHWLAQAQGALAAAQLVKTFHLHTPVILMGLAAGYYHRELMDYPQVSCVLRGEPVGGALSALLRALSSGEQPWCDVPGLTWRTRTGEVVENALPAVAEDEAVDGPGPELEHGWGGCLPLARQFISPFAVPLAARGCTQDCVVCHNSTSASRRLYGSSVPTCRLPERLAGDLFVAHRQGHKTAYVVGDITQAAPDYMSRFLQAVRLGRAPDLVCFDLFQPLSCRLLGDIVNSLPNAALDIVMHSPHAGIRQAVGRHYGNAAIEQTIAYALALGYARVRLYFTIGLPDQDYDAALSAAAYSEELLTRFRGDRRLQPFVTPLAPFLDAGCSAFEEPERVGYHLSWRTLEEHRRARLCPSWKHALNYETRHMTRDDLARATYDVTLAMARLRARHGMLSVQQVQEVEQSVSLARRLMEEIDLAVGEHDPDRVEYTLSRLKPQIDEANRAGLKSQNLLSALLLE